MSLAAGFNLLSSQVPQAGGITTVLGYNPHSGDTLYQWNGNGWNILTYYDAIDANPEPAGGMTVNLT